jgi:hypothetical protein
MRRLFLTHVVAVTRLVGVIFILFGARSTAAAVGRAAAGMNLLSKVAGREALVIVGWHRCIRHSVIGQD